MNRNKTTAGREGTQRRLILLLCRGRQTVNELAAALRITDNGVRAQLDALMQEGLVRQVGMRRGVRRPHVEYELTGAAARFFPNAYEPALRFLAEVVLERLPERTHRELFLEAGRRLLSPLIGDIVPRDPTQWAAEVVNRLKGRDVGVEIVDETNRTLVRACICPLATITSRHPQTCAVLAGLLSEFSRSPIRECCERGASPRCAFEIAGSHPRQRE